MNSQVEGNIAPNGGALYLEKDVYIEMDHTLLKENIANHGTGSCIQMKDKSTARIRRSHFNKNEGMFYLLFSLYLFTYAIHFFYFGVEIR